MHLQYRQSDARHDSSTPILQVLPLWIQKSRISSSIQLNNFHTDHEESG